MAKPTIVPLCGSPEARARMARWLEGWLGDGPLPSFEEMPDTPLKRLAMSCPPADPDAPLVYIPQPPVDEDDD